ncbi:39S ribosomal protein L35, mitochondrial [Aphelenchoides besseyi]|nr:39S ribosomal protein L35, mitochondrial [Aphelenchoides besseyi]
MLSRATNRAAPLLQSGFRSGIEVCRNVARIPHYEHHIRFDQHVGRKRVAQDVLDRFKRLNNGMWIRPQAGRNKKRYARDDLFRDTSTNYVTCTQEQCEMLDKLMTPFWLRRKHYVDDPYEPYHVRRGITSPRVDYKGRLVRERPKVLLDDTTSDKHFFDR